MDLHPFEFCGSWEREPCIHEDALLRVGGLDVGLADDGTSPAGGDMQGRSDPSRKTSRCTKAGPCIPRAARRCSYTPPTESRSSGPTLRSTDAAMREFGEEGEAGSRTQDTRNHRSAVILVGGISVAAAVPEHQ